MKFNSAPVNTVNNETEGSGDVWEVYKQQMEELTNRNKSLLSERYELRSRCDELTKEVERVRDESAMQLTVKDDFIFQLEQRMEQERNCDIVGRLQKQIIEFKECLSLKNEEAEELRKKVASALLCTSHFQERIVELEASHRKEKSERLLHEGTIKQLNIEKMKLEEEIERLHSEKCQIHNRCLAVEQESFHSHTNHMKEISRIKEYHAKEMSEMSASLVAARERFSQLEMKFSEIESERRDSAQRLEFAEKSMAIKARQTEDGHAEQMEELERLVRSLREEKDKAQAQLLARTQSLECTLEVLQRENRTSRECLDAATGTRDALMRALEEKERRLEYASGEQSILAHEIEALRHRLETAEARARDLLAHESETVKLRAQHQALLQRSTEDQREYTESTSALTAELSALRVSQQKERHALAEQVHEMALKAKAARREWKLKEDELCTKYLSLYEKYKRLEASHNVNSIANARLQAQVDALGQSLRTLSQCTSPSPTLPPSRGSPLEPRNEPEKPVQSGVREDRMYINFKDDPLMMEAVNLTTRMDQTLERAERLARIHA